MKLLKKMTIAYAVFSLILLCLSPPSRTNITSHAETTYAYIKDSQVYFYSSESEDSGLFIIPQSYFVAVYRMGAIYCQVGYMSEEKQKEVIGYCKTSEIEIVSFTPQMPSARKTFTLTYVLPGSSLTSSGMLTSIEVSVTYYGDFPIGSVTYCYVNMDGNFGYVPKPNDLYIPKNDEYDAINTVAPAPPEKEEEKTAQSSKIAVIIVLSAVCAIALFFLLFNHKKVEKN